MRTIWQYYRYDSRLAYSNLGGVTLRYVITDAPQFFDRDIVRVDVGFSLCHDEDNFNKKIGRAIVYENLYWLDGIERKGIIYFYTRRSEMNPLLDNLMYALEHGECARSEEGFDKTDEEYVRLLKKKLKRIHNENFWANLKYSPYYDNMYDNMLF